MRLDWASAALVSAEPRGDVILLTFDKPVMPDDLSINPEGFSIAGEDGKFVPAEATIDGNTVVVQAKDVQSPIQVRFGWRNEANPNLSNKEGLPASPFQSNNWQGGMGE